MKPRWRVGSQIALNVYEGARPVCQCHSELDATRIVEAMNLFEFRAAPAESTGEPPLTEEEESACREALAEYTRGETVSMETLFAESSGESEEPVILQCGTCRTFIKPEFWEGSCPGCGNGTVKELSLAQFNATSVPAANQGERE